MKMHSALKWKLLFSFDYSIQRRIKNTKGGILMIKEITAQELNTGQFIDEKVKDIQTAVGDGTAINALSGGVDSSVVTMLGHRALGKKLQTVFIENGLMREGRIGTGRRSFPKARCGR
jgi:GMP synthase (glutamine-hydrolysing)